MPSLLVRCVFFISSYFPLTLIFFVMLLNNKGIGGLIAAICVLAVGVGSIIFLYMTIESKRHKKTGFHRKAVEVRGRDGDVMSYIASYIVPFVTFSLDGWQSIFALVVFLLVLAILYVNSNMMYINPMLSLVGYHLYEVVLEQDETPHYLVARSHPKRDRTLFLVKMSEGVFLEKSVAHYDGNPREDSSSNSTPYSA